MQKVKAYGKFANKLWNITRFVLENKTEGKVDEKIKKEIGDLAKDVTSDMENYRFYLASEKIYHYIWHRFADEIIEESKKNTELKPSLLYVLENSLKLLHPFMPFVTEEIWSLLPDRKNLLLVESWPKL
jgi:valyl-tRNA synthetase